MGRFNCWSWQTSMPYWVPGSPSQGGSVRIPILRKDGDHRLACKIAIAGKWKAWWLTATVVAISRQGCENSSAGLIAPLDRC